MNAAIAEERMTTEEFLKKYGHCSGVELVRGKVVWAGQSSDVPDREFHMAKFRHGVICNTAARVIDEFVKAHDLGWVAINDTFLPTGSDSVRGADVLYASFKTVPKGEPPEDLLVAPELVIEVRSPSDRWTAMIEKALEYLNAGVTVVVILDPKTKSATAFRADERQEIASADDELTLPDVLPGFAVPVRKFFE